MIPPAGSSALLGLFLAAHALLGQVPHPVRHQVSVPGDAEFLILRHQFLKKGRHEDFYQVSREGVWPIYEKIGTRVVGQWQVLLPEDEDRENDEGYRLARYRSFRHWLATRRPASLAGDGEDYVALQEAIRLRNQWRVGSKGVVYLTGEMASGGPVYSPPMEESYRLVPESGTDDGADLGAVHPIRSERAKRSPREVVALRYFKVRKGAFDELDRLTREAIWPFGEKMGLRPLGLWRVVYPTDEDFAADPQVSPPPELPTENPDFDEAYMMVRYASREHWQATRRDVMHRLGGDGDDYRSALEAFELRDELIVDTSVELLQGYLYGSPPVYLPPLDESYEKLDP